MSGDEGLIQESNDLRSILDMKDEEIKQLKEKLEKVEELTKENLILLDRYTKLWEKRLESK